MVYFKIFLIKDSPFQKNRLGPIKQKYSTVFKEKERENGQVWTKFYQKWALNFSLHLNAHFSLVSSMLIEHILL